MPAVRLPAPAARRSPFIPALLAPALLAPALLAAGSLLALALLADPHGAFDLQVYREAVRWWTSGSPLYDYVHPGSPYGFTYPPFAALLMLPLAVLPLWLALALNVVVDAAVITVTTWWLAAQVAPRYGLPVGWATACAVPLVCLLEPVRDTVGFGQVNLALVALVVLDVQAVRRGSRWAGVGTGLAAAVKLTPAVFVVLLLATRPRAARTAVVTGAVATAVAAVVAPGTSWTFWTSAVFDTSRVGRTDLAANQALSGVLARLADAPVRPLLPWLCAVAVVGAVGLVRAWRAVRAGDDLAGLALVGLTGGLVSPISWTHHLWWVVPAVAVLLRGGAASRWQLRAGLAAAALFASSLPDAVRQPLGAHLSIGPLGVLAESSYALACLLLVALLPVAAGPPRAAPEPALTRV